MSPSPCQVCAISRDRGQLCSDAVFWGQGGWRRLGLVESQSPRPFSRAGLLMGQLQPFIQAFTLKSNNRKGGGEDCGRDRASAPVRVGWIKSECIPKYQRDEVRQPGPIPPTQWYVAPCLLWASIRMTKELSTHFDPFTHFHHSAVFFLS